MIFEEVINIIENKRRFGKACGRDVTIELMEALGHPDTGMHIIHIAGTNGKGSVAAFVSSILQAASFSSENHFKVGTFTSPHLVDFTESIMVDGQQISREDATRIGERLLELEVKLEPTMFDYCLAMAMIYFKEQGVKYVVLETGLGGSKDSTAGLMQVPEVCAITSIGLEHTAILGDTLEAIAAEKAGIIKAGTKAVIGEMDSVASNVIIKKCNSLLVPYVEAGEVSPDTKLGLFGKYQRKNAAVAVKIAELLDIEISSQIIARGLANARWQGRMDVLCENPYILLDGAHNPSGVQALHDSLVAEFGNEKYTFIMAVMADKDYCEMANIMGDIAERVYALSVDYERALQAKELAGALTAAGFNATSFESYQDALCQAKKHSEKIIVFGSLYFIGDVLKEGKNND